MTLEELKAEAARHGYRLQSKRNYDCSCYMPYPNERHRNRNGSWKCVDKYEPSDYKASGKYFNPCTYCIKNVKVADR